MQTLTIADIMDSNPPFIRANQPLNEVVSELVSHHVGGLPVIDDQKHVLGFVSEQDCIHSLKVSSYHSEGVLRVEDVMNHEVYAVPPDMLVIDLVEHMGNNKPKVFPVTRNGQLVGLVCRPQVLFALAESCIGSGFTFRKAHETPIVRRA